MVQAATAQAPGLTTEPLSPNLGVRITDVDVGTELTDAVFEQIHAAYLKHHVVSIAGQALTTSQFMALGRRLGHLEPHVLSQYHHPEHPEILMLSNRQRPDGTREGLADAGTYWHSDLSYKACPARTTILHALVAPEGAGDTMFANMTLAYEELPEALKRSLEGRTAAHDYAFRSDRLAEQDGTREKLTPEQRAQVPTVHHPVFRTHPETGRKAVFVNPGFTMRIDGVGQDESDRLLSELFGHCLQRRYQLRYQWKPGDVVFWDNAAVLHSATKKHLEHHQDRCLWRLTVSGDEPF